MRRHFLEPRGVTDKLTEALRGKSTVHQPGSQKLAGFAARSGVVAPVWQSDTRYEGARKKCEFIALSVFFLQGSRLLRFWYAFGTLSRRKSVTPVFTIVWICFFPGFAF